jgi:hypothetical protein
VSALYNAGLIEPEGFLPEAVEANRRGTLETQFRAKLGQGKLLLLGAALSPLVLALAPRHGGRQGGRE